MNDILKRIPPPNDDPDPTMWVDEAIWGHRLHDEQTPWLVYMEFLNIFHHENSKGCAFTEPGGYNTLHYHSAKRLHLRNILFNNPKMEEIRYLYSADCDRWEAWLNEMTKIQNIEYPNFSFLQDRFHTFDDFYHIVTLLRATSLENNSNKRWTSKFVYPYCEAGLYVDLDKNANSNDRRFFGRTGEMLYLMLCRAKNSADLAKKINKKIIGNDSIWNKIIKCLQPPDACNDRVASANMFVPYEDHRCFDELADDWLAILDLNIPGYDSLPYLVNLIGLHIINYQLTIAAQLTNTNKPTLICEIVAPKKTLVRELAFETYYRNNILPAQALNAYVSNVLETEGWKRALSSHDPYIECRNILKKEYLWPRKETDYQSSNDPDRLFAEFKKAATKRHQLHVGRVHRSYGREIGLVSRRGTNRLRYAPTDELLKTLLFANVEKRMELHLFLERLWKRYGIVIGDVQGEAAKFNGDFDKKAFQANSRRLEQRLVSLGLLNRLSDGCAYVVNPYYSRSDNGN